MSLLVHSIYLQVIYHHQTKKNSLLDPANTHPDIFSFRQSLPKQCHRFSSSILRVVDQFEIESNENDCKRPCRVLFYFE